MVSQNVIPSKRSLGGSLPYAFTQEGVAMLSSVLRSERAVLVNIEIMRTFVRLRQMLASNVELARRLDDLERKEVTTRISGWGDVKLQWLLHLKFDSTESLFADNPRGRARRDGVGRSWLPHQPVAGRAGQRHAGATASLQPGIEPGREPVALPEEPFLEQSRLRRPGASGDGRLAPRRARRAPHPHRPRRPLPRSRYFRLYETYSPPTSSGGRRWLGPWTDRRPDRPRAGPFLQR